MRVLVTGHDGYLGSAMVPALRQAGHDVVGLDTLFFAGCTLGPRGIVPDAIRGDVRDVTADHLRGFDAVIHLAALSNDPLGNIDAELTYEINYRSSVRLAVAARDAGVSRFLFSSSCSVYGAASPDDILDEAASFHPVTAYGISKVQTEEALDRLASPSFSPTYLRNATAYGFAPQLRLDLVVNDLVASACRHGTVLVKSDGTPWRPLVHVDDIAAAFCAVLAAPRERVHNQAFNVGRDEDNYQVSDIARMVQEAVAGSSVEYAPGGGPDKRCYRVHFGKLARLPEFQPSWSVARGVSQLRDAYRAYDLSGAEVDAATYHRLARIRSHLDAGRLDAALRWREVATS